MIATLGKRVDLLRKGTRMPRNTRALFGEAGLPCEDQSCDIVNHSGNGRLESLLFRGGLLAGLTRRSFVLL